MTWIKKDLNMNLKEKVKKIFKGFIYFISGEERKEFYANRKFCNLKQINDDRDFLFKEMYNPATGFTMNGAVDGAGNNYGCSSSIDYSSSHNNQMDYSRDPFNDFNIKYY